MKRRMKSFLLKIAKNYPLFRTFMRKCLYIKNRVFHFYMLFYKVDSKLIVFEAYAGRSYSCSPKALYEAMLNDIRFKDYKFVWFFKDVEKSSQYVKADPRLSVYKFKSFNYYKYLGKASYWITNFSLAIDLYKKKNQIYIQTWHGSPFKNLGLDVVNNTSGALNSKKDIIKRYKKYALTIDYFLTQSSWATKVQKHGFNFTNHTTIIEEGYPRNDSLFHYTKDDITHIKEKLGIPHNKKIILYVPTYRENNFKSDIGYVYESPINFEKLKTILKDEYVILFRAHYLVANSFDFKKYASFIYDVSDYNDINDLFIISDLMMTDYSSCTYDFGNLSRPQIFYMYDLDEYQNNIRGITIPLEKLPGNIVQTEKELFEIFKDIPSYEEKTKQKANDFKRNYLSLDDGSVALRVIDKIFKRGDKL